MAPSGRLAAAARLALARMARAALVASLATPVWVPTALATAPRVPDAERPSAESTLEEIRRLRAAALYDSALRVNERLLADLRADLESSDRTHLGSRARENPPSGGRAVAENRGSPDSHPGSHPDSIGHLVRTAEESHRLLLRVARFADADRRAMAEADRLDADIEALFGRRDLQNAEVAARRQLEIRQKLLGRTSVEVALSLNNLAQVLQARGEYAAAEPHFRRSAEIVRAVYGGDHPHLAVALNNLAFLLKERAEFDDAGKLYEEVLALRRRTLSADGPDLALSLNNLAALRNAQGRRAEAERLYRESLAIRRKVHGGDHPEVAQSLTNLAVTLRNRGDYHAAEPLYWEALAIRRRTLGDEHPQIGNSLHNLAVLYRAQGDLLQSEALHRDALDLRRRVLGEDHPVVSQERSNLAQVLRMTGELEEARALLTTALHAQRDRLGPDHPQIGSTLEVLSAVEREAGDHDAAMEHARASLELRRRTLGGRHPFVARSLEALGRAQQAAAAGPSAEASYRAALEIRQEVFGDGHPETVETLAILGALLLSAGRPADALEPLQRASAGYESARARAGTGLARAAFLEPPYSRLASCLLELGRTDEAWVAAERGGGRLLADLLLASREGRMRPDQAARQDSLGEALGRLEEQLSELEGAKELEPSTETLRSLRRTRDRLASARAAWSTLQHEIMQAFPVEEGASFSLARIQEELSPSTAIVGWVDPVPGTSRTASWVYVIRRDGAVRWGRDVRTLDVEPARGRDSRAVDGDPADAAAVALAFRDDLVLAGASLLGAPRAYRPGIAGGRLWQSRFAPVDRYLDGVTDLVVLPSGPMLGVPVEAIPMPDGRFLGDRFRVVYAPSATIHASLRGTERLREIERPRRTERVGMTERLPSTDRPMGTDRLREPARAAGRSLSPALVVGDPTYEKKGSWKPASLQWSPGPLRGDDRSSLREPASREPASRERRGSPRSRHEPPLPRLEWSRTEAEQVAAAIGDCEVLLGADASEPRIAALASTGALRRYRCLHFATHAIVDDERPERSGIVLARTGLEDPLAAALAGERIFDGIVTAGEIAREWRLDASLVTLSACATARGRDLPGEGTIGLAHAILQAGARSVLVSLWPVNDEAAALLMRRFYELCTADRSVHAPAGIDPSSAGGTRPDGPGTKSLALQQAKRWLREYTDSTGRQPFSHPFYWSAFVLIGHDG